MTKLVPFMRRHTLGDWVYEFDRMLEPVQREQNSFTLRGDIQETDEHLLMSFDFPGMLESDFSVQVHENILSLSGERKLEISDDEKNKYKHIGRPYGKFHKQFSLPKTINTGAIEADYQNGVLRIVLPKTEPEIPNKVEVKVGGKSSLLEKLVNKK